MSWRRPQISYLFINGRRILVVRLRRRRPAAAHALFRLALRRAA